jgi:hypothetical protein
VRCAAAVDQDGELSEQGRVGLLEECYGKALDSLRGAAAAGWSDAAILRENSEWEPLRGMPEFEALLEELQRSLR